MSLISIEINIEVPPAMVTAPESAVYGALKMVEQFSNIQVRPQQTAYPGPDGEVKATTVIAKFNWPWGGLLAPLTRLAYVFDQDCLAARWEDSTGRVWEELYGPRRDKWLPFNREYFIRF